MLILAHFKKQNLNQLIQELIELKNKYSSNAFGVERDLLVLLEKSEIFLKQIGKSSIESKISTLRTYIHTATAGINPRSLEIIKTEKRKIVKSATFFCHSELSTILENEIDAINTMLSESEEMLSQVILSLVQSGKVTVEMLEALNTIEKISLFWNSLVAQNEQINLINIQLKRKILKEDIHFLIQDIINKLKTE